MASIFLASDHAGFTIKEWVKRILADHGYIVTDLTPRKTPGDDYPFVGRALARRVVKTGARGILVCGTGVGMTIAANRVSGARAVQGFTANQVALARKHNDVNILTLGGRSIPRSAITALVMTFLTTRASSATRHRRRVAQLG
jgi:ribose 5-phosphate isomerase B